MPDTQSESEKYLLDEQVSFTQHFLPGLDAGQYKLTVDQEIFESDGTTSVSGEAYSNSYTFSVTGDRFALSSPSSVVYSTFPADSASGEFSNVLPHVVFRKHTFPWIRFPTIDAPYSPPPPGKDVDADVPTWLFVLILDEDDVAANPGLDVAQPATATVGDLFTSPSPEPTSTLGKGNYSMLSTATDFADLAPGQNTTDPIHIIDVPLELFWKIGPTLDDLKLLAHGRTVSLVNQPTEGSPLGQPTGTFSIVFGNRLPATGKRSSAFLVSLEALEDFLPQTGGLPPAHPQQHDADTLLRLPVLASWQFFSTGESATFVHQLESLNGRTAGSATPAPDTNVRLSYEGSNKVVAAALDMGYTALNETMRTAEDNVSWYRGPLLPHPPTGPAIDLPIPSPDAATIFDPTTGMLDTSYAAAWSIGRLLALQDVSFSTGLYNWKQSLSEQVQSSVESDIVAEATGMATDDQAVSGPTAPAGSLLKHTVRKLGNGASS